MSLATRCTACGTVFRVVQDQLKVSEGWVRCGRCEQVFNALEGLFDLDREPPPPWPAPPAPVPLDETPAVSPEPDKPVITPYATATRLDVQPLLDDDDDGEHDDFADARFPSDFPPDVLADADTVAEPSTIADTVAEGSTLPEGDAPGFVRRAERAERWRRPGVRAALVVLALLLVTVLAAQVGIHHRDDIVAQHSQARPVIEPLCALAGCRIEAPRLVDALAVDSSGLVKLEGPNTLYRFDLVLRNGSDTPVLMPAIELTLTDPQGRLVSRKVLTAGELGAADAAIAAGADVALRGVLEAGTRRIVGYQLEIFYP